VAAQQRRHVVQFYRGDAVYLSVADDLPLAAGLAITPSPTTAWA
jgi:hypothetical protein